MSIYFPKMQLLQKYFPFPVPEPQVRHIFLCFCALLLIDGRLFRLVTFRNEYMSNILALKSSIQLRTNWYLLLHGFSCFKSNDNLTPLGQRMKLSRFKCPRSHQNLFPGGCPDSTQKIDTGLIGEIDWEERTRCSSPDATPVYRLSFFLSSN